MFDIIVNFCANFCFIITTLCIFILIVLSVISAIQEVRASRKKASVKKFVIFFKGRTTGTQMTANSLSDLLSQFSYVLDFFAKDFVVYSVHDFDNENLSDWVFEGIFNKDGERIY